MKTFAWISGCLLLLGWVGLHLHRAGLVHAQSGNALLHRNSSFDLVIKQPYDKVGLLFGANGERAWGGADWDPRFIYPIPAHDTAGAVFTVEHGGHKTLWITPIYDLAARHIQHLIIVPNALVTQLDITFSDPHPAVTHVHVEWQRTALASDFNSHVERLAEHDFVASQEWQEAIDKYFSTAEKH